MSRSVAAVWRVTWKAGKRLRILGLPVTESMMGSPVFRSMAGVLRPDHPATGHDDAVVSVTLAAQAIVAQYGVEPLGTVEVTVLGWDHDPRRKIRGAARVYPGGG